MRIRRCCPADCAIRSDWEKELKEENSMIQAVNNMATVEERYENHLA